MSLGVAFSSHLPLIFLALLGCRLFCLCQIREASSVADASLVSLLFSVHCLLYDINIWCIVRQTQSSENKKKKGTATEIMQY